MNDGWPCHRKPKDEWCDPNGPGDFMGHTCRTIEKLQRLAPLWQARREVQIAEDRLHEANIRLAKLAESF